MIFLNRKISCYHTQRKQIVLLYIGALPTRTEGMRQQGHYNEDTALVPVPVYPPEECGGGATVAVVYGVVVGVQAP